MTISITISLTMCDINLYNYGLTMCITMGATDTPIYTPLVVLKISPTTISCGIP